MNGLFSRTMHVFWATSEEVESDVKLYFFLENHNSFVNTETLNLPYQFQDGAWYLLSLLVSTHEEPLWMPRWMFDTLYIWWCQMNGCYGRHFPETVSFVYLWTRPWWLQSACQFPIWRWEPVDRLRSVRGCYLQSLTQATQSTHRSHCDVSNQCLCNNYCNGAEYLRK